MLFKQLQIICMFNHRWFLVVDVLEWLNICYCGLLFEGKIYMIYSVKLASFVYGSFCMVHSLSSGTRKHIFTISYTLCCLKFSKSKTLIYVSSLSCRSCFLQLCFNLIMIVQFFTFSFTQFFWHLIYLKYAH